MSGFSGDWLALREPFDTRARGAAAVDLGLHEALGTMASRLAGRHDRRLQVLDLACGTGASLRALSGLLAVAGAPLQHWTVVDHDADLLAQWPRRLADWSRDRDGVTSQEGEEGDGALRLQGPRGVDLAVLQRRIDLAADLEMAPFEQADLVTASALLDLVSEDWIDRLVACCRRRRAMVLMALSVDGRHAWTPIDPDDERVGHAFAGHQRRDKGFGPALGGDAVHVARRAFEAAGYEVRHARSDWTVDPQGSPHDSSMALSLLESMIDGLSSAAIEQCPDEAPAIGAWRDRRLRSLEGTRLVVGHVDLLAVPPRAPDRR